MIAILFGPPGSGKGTQAGYASRQFGIPHVSTGNILREEVGRGTAVGRKVAPILERGELVPDELILEIVANRIEEHREEGALLDGFPRTVAQAKGLSEMLAQHGLSVSVVVTFDVPEDKLIERILHRGEVDHRSDDNRESFAVRMEEYRHKTSPVLDYFSQSGVQVVHVDGNDEIEHVANAMCTVLSRMQAGPAKVGEA